MQMDYDMITPLGLISAPYWILEGSRFMDSAPYWILKGSGFMDNAPYWIWIVHPTDYWKVVDLWILHPTRY